MRVFLYFSLILLSGCQLKISYLGAGVVQITGDYQLIECDIGDLCADVGYNDKVTLTAVPESGYSFVGWSGHCRGSEVCTVSLNNDREVRAHFSPSSEMPKTIEFNPGNSYFFASPWPNDLRLDNDGRIDVRAFPFERNGLWSEQLENLAEKTPGFATNGAINFQVSWPLPDIEPMSTSNALLFPLDLDTFEPVGVTLHTFNTDQSERSGLISFMPNRPLLSNTRYALVVKSAIASDLSVENGIFKNKLIRDFDAQLNELSELELKYQQQYVDVVETLSAYRQDKDNIVAFTVFTTQNTQRYVELIQNTIQDWNRDMVLQSVSYTGGTLCNYEPGFPNYIARSVSLEVEFPNYLTGVAPYTDGGGAFEIENSKLVQQGTQTVRINMAIPCSVPSSLESLGVMVRGAGTAEYTSNDWYSQGVIEVTVDAPYSDGPRAIELTGLLATIVDMAGIDNMLIAQLLSHFNPLNMGSNLGLHYQYGVDLVYARQLANYLADYVVQDWPVPISTEQTIYAGESFGAMAAMHAARIDPTTDALNLNAMSRMSQHSVNHIVSQVGLIPEEAVDLISLYVGVKLPLMPADPTLQLLQASLEPLDVVNHVPYLADLPMLVTMDKYEDAYHGGPSSYQLLKVLDQSVAFNLEYGRWSEVIPGTVSDTIENTLGRSYSVDGDYDLPIAEETPLRLVKEFERYYDGLCFSYAVFNLEHWSSEYDKNHPCF